MKLKNTVSPERLKKRLFLTIAFMTLIIAPSKAQFVVSDPSNLAQSIINSANQIIETSSTAASMVETFNETVKIYEQGKQYYDALRSVSNLVKDAKKVQESMLMVGEISEIFIKNYNNMLADPNFSIEELSAIAYGYTEILKESSSLLGELRSVVTSGNGLSLTDKDRMEVVDKVHREMREYRDLTNYYTNKHICVSYLRSKSRNEVNKVMALYGDPYDRYW